jgi:hypothetical protein
MVEEALQSCSEAAFLVLGSQLWLRGNKLARNKLSGVSMRRYREMFGCSPFLCSVIWEYLIDGGQLVAATRGIRSEHLLWALMFLKLYQTEAVSALVCRCDEKTYRKWIWIVIRALADVDVVRHGKTICRLLLVSCCVHAACS